MSIFQEHIFNKISIKKEHLLISIIFLLAVFIRISNDPEIPFHYDPGKNIVYARAALQWFPLFPQYNPYFNLGEYYEYQVLFPYLIAFLYKISGFSLLELTKWLVVIGGAALSLTVYYLSLEITNNKKSALISAFLVAVSKIQLMAYMNYYPQIIAMTIMPLTFVFLIRYCKFGKFKYLFFAAMMSSLIVLASYIAAFVYFIIVLLSLVVYGIKEKRMLKPFLAIPLMTALLLTFFWLPMVWRHGILTFKESFIDRIYDTQVAFTNAPWTLTNYITFSNSTIIAIILGIAAIFFIKKLTWDFQKILIATWLLITFILMESYILKPILWVDRYFQFFDIALLLIAGGIMAFFIEKFNNFNKIRFNYKGYFLLLLLVFPLYGAVNADYAFGKWGYPSDISMLEYMKTLPSGSLVVAPSGIHSFWVSALSGQNVLAGDSSQMMEQTYMGDSDSDLIINSPDIGRKMEIIRKYGVNYVYISVHRSLYMVWTPLNDLKGIEAFNDTSYFEINKVYEDGYGATILIKIKEDLKPKYNIEKINWNSTAAGYLISIISFLVFVYLYKIKDL